MNALKDVVLGLKNYSFSLFCMKNFLFRKTSPLCLSTLRSAMATSTATVLKRDVDLISI